MLDLIDTFLDEIEYDETITDWQRVPIDDPDDAESYIPIAKALTKPTEAQIEAGNYKKKHVDWNGLSISIENEKGSTRSGGEGKDAWSCKMYHDYGYIKRTEGVDGDHVDVYLGPNKSAENVYIVHQANPETGEYDEDKCMLGFDSEDDAKKAYLKQYDSTKFFGAMSSIPFALFKEKVFDDKGEPIVPDAKRLVAGERLKSLIYIGRSNVDESTNGLSTPRAILLKEIEENGAHLSDVFWMQWRQEIVEMEHEGLIESLDVSGYGQLGQTVRTLKLTPRGRLTMMIGSRETSGKI